MPLQPPNLDDRRFADIFKEARTLIPRYVPEWTDHSDSDPGIGLLQLFAWMTDLLLYRVNRIPERNYIKFLELIGIELEPAASARAELTFSLSRDDIDHVIVPMRTQVAASGTDGKPVVFETDRALVAIGARLADIQVYDGISYSVRSMENEADDQWLHAFGNQAREGSALLLGFETPRSQFTEQNVDLYVRVYTEGLKEMGRHCDVDLSRVPPPAELVWEYWAGTAWEPLILERDDTRAFTVSGHVTFRGPGAAIQRVVTGAVDESRFWVRCRLQTSQYDLPPRLLMIRTNTVPATEAITIFHEILGESDGYPNQAHFQTAETPILVREEPRDLPGAYGRRVTVESIQLEVNEVAERGFEVWQEVDDFYASTADDPHFVVNRTSGTITFGDGERGRIPVAGAQVVAREYRVGGGKRGNVGANTISELQTSVPSVDTVTNLLRAQGGADEETVDAAKRRAPRELQSRQRAVTAADFEFLAEQSPGTRVRRAKALPLRHPSFGAVDVPGVVTLVVVPESEAPNPLPGEATLQAVCAHMNRHRLLTTELYIVPPTYRLVRVDVDVIARPEADLAVVQRGLQDRLAEYLHALTGGADGKGWPFGGPLYYSELYREILNVEGVLRIRDNQLVIWLDGTRQPFCRDVEIEPGELLHSDVHRVGVTYDVGGM